MVAQALRQSSSYEGREDQREAILGTLVGFEEWLGGQFGLAEGAKVDSVREDSAHDNWNTWGTRRRISDFLEMAGTAYEKYLDSALVEARELVRTNLGQVILPPGDGQIRAGLGDGIEPARFQERLKELLITLEENGIYSDDVIVIDGRVHERMMRKRSYTIVEIPRLNREVLVCPQVGEATFVVYGILGRTTLASLSKEELLEQFGVRVSRIIYQDSDQWRSQVVEALFKDIKLDELKKIDVSTQEGLRQLILQDYPTPESWMAMKNKERRTYKVAGMGLIALSNRFGVDGNPTRHLTVHKALGMKIYGEHHECLKATEQKDNEELIRLVLKNYPTPESWIAMEKKERLAYKVAGMGLIALSTRLGVEGNPNRYREVRKTLGRKIYGEHHECLKATEQKEYTKEELIQLILKDYRSPESWVALKHKERQAYKVAGMGLRALATRFGIEGDAAHYHEIHRALGRKIYGEHHECLKATEKKENTNEELIRLILKDYPTPESWVALKQKERRAYSVAGLGLIALSTRFGTKGDPASYHEIYKALGRKIYGEHHACLKAMEKTEKKEYTNEELIQLIQKDHPTPESWVALKHKERQAYKVAGMGLLALSTRLGIEEDPVKDREIYKALGRKIYGEHHECLKVTEKKEYTNEELINLILKDYPTPESWVEVKNREKLAYKVAGMGLIALSTRLGIQGDPNHYPEIFRTLGRRIYGEQHKCLQPKKK